MKLKNFSTKINSQAKHVVKNVSENRSMWIYGKHAVAAAILNKKRHIKRFVALESLKGYFESQLGDQKISPEIVDTDFFLTKFGKNATHQGCAILAEPLKEMFLEDLLFDAADERPFVFLDQVTDPQNVGSILRASAVFGARAVVVTENSSPEMTPAIAKSASGATELVPLIHVTNLVQSLNLLKEKGFWCVGLDERGQQELSQIDLAGKIAIVVGSEGEGLRRLTRELCDFLAQLPFFENFSTLNAAQAATVSLYEILRQHNQRK